MKEVRSEAGKSGFHVGEAIKRDAELARLCHSDNIPLSLFD